MDIGMLISALCKSLSSADFGSTAPKVLPKPEKLAGRLREYVESHLEFFSVHTLSNIVKGFGSVAEAAQGHGAKRGAAGAPAQVSGDILERLCGCVDTRRMLDAITAEWQPKIEEIRPFQLSQLLFGLSKLSSFGRDDSSFFIPSAQVTLKMVNSGTFEKQGAASEANCLTLLAEAYALAAKNSAKIRESPKVVKLLDTIAAVAARKFQNFRADEKATFAAALRDFAAVSGSAVLQNGAKALEGKAQAATARPTPAPWAAGSPPREPAA